MLGVRMRFIVLGVVMLSVFYPQFLKMIDISVDIRGALSRQGSVVFYLILIVKAPVLNMATRGFGNTQFDSDLIMKAGTPN